MRTVIIHNHLFKNAGSTIDYALRKNFADGFVDHRDDDDMRRGAEYLQPYLLENTWIRALSTHHLVLPLPDAEELQLLELMMLRHPVERVISVYRFERAQKDATTPGAIHARKLGFREYVAWRMQPDVGNTIRNFYISRCLPPRERKRAPYTESELELAKDHLRKTPLLGVVEMFDESMAVMEEVLGQYFSGMDMSYVPQNVGDKQGGSRCSKIEHVRNELGEDLFEQLMQNNREDMVLYESAVNILKERITGQASFRKKLRCFRSRCFEPTGGWLSRGLRKIGLRI